MRDVDDLVVALERPLPKSLPVGSATTLFLFGICFHRRRSLERLEILVDGVRHRPTAFRMPRPDVAAPFDVGHHSGFWATVDVPARRHPGVVQLQVGVGLEGGEHQEAPLGTIEVFERREPSRQEAQPERAGPPLIAVCMATFEPNTSLFRTQIESLRAQTDDAWICLISDDCSRASHIAEMEQIVGNDPRFLFSRSDERQGFYRNFERALEMAPADALLIALCDQDDRWYQDKLEVLRGALGGTVLVYSDQRLTDACGRVLRETLWRGRSNNHTNLASMLIANTVTGAAALFRRDLLDVILPFPDTPGFQFHDHWLGVAALATGEVAYVDRPLYDYVQHPDAVFGDVTSGRSTGPRARWSSARDGARALLGGERAGYFYGYLARRIQAQVLLVRAGKQLTRKKRRILRRFVDSASSPAAFLWLAARPTRVLLGRTETLGSEAQLARGILWLWVALWASRLGKGFDSSFPPPGSFNQPRLRRWRARL